MAHEDYQGTHKGRGGTHKGRGYKGGMYKSGGYKGSSKMMGKSYYAGKTPAGGAWGYYKLGSGTKMGMYRQMKMRYGEEHYSGVRAKGTGYG